MKNLKDSIKSECNAILEDLDEDFKDLGKRGVEAYVISYTTYIKMDAKKLDRLLERYIILSAIEDNHKVILIDREDFHRAIPGLQV